MEENRSVYANDSKLTINEQSIKTELASYKDKPMSCLVEYIWNAFDANASKIELNFTSKNSIFSEVENVSLKDNGDGWDLDNTKNTNQFMASTKEVQSNQTLPHGKYGRGRYSFIWIAEELHIFSKSQKMILKCDTDILKEPTSDSVNGTLIKFERVNELFSNFLLSDNLEQNLAMEFGWFLIENEKRQIIINGKVLDIYPHIKDSKEIREDSLPEDIKRELGTSSFLAKIILWENKPSEYSKFYFLDVTNNEFYKCNTGLNKKSDNFWHSVYIQTSIFSSNLDIPSEEKDGQEELPFEGKNKQNLKKKILNYLKEELANIRKPYLIAQSSIMLKTLKEEKLLPNLVTFGIYDTKSYEDLIKTIYTITPSLFVGNSNNEKKFICSTFAGLLTAQDDTLIKKILEQLQDLTESEKNDLLDILNRTTLSNVVKTIKEIDHRIDVIEKMKILISEYKQETLEVKHIQKILDENFWIFGEQFRLFTSTEGALRKTLVKYAKEILGISNPELVNSPGGELDLFLVKEECSNESRKQNIIIEIKRPSVKLGKDEYNQIESYMEKICTESICNGSNQYWEFYLIGSDYDTHIENKIESAKNHGEKNRGLCYNIYEGRIKIYVRKWSDILDVEWGRKMSHLKEKLKIQCRKTGLSPTEITNEILSNK